MLTMRRAPHAAAIVCALLGVYVDGADCASRRSEASGTLPGIAAIDHRVHGAGNIFHTVTNVGMLGSAPGSRLVWSTAPSAQWPKGSETEYLWVMGLWLGALKDNVPAVTTAAYQLEFRPDLSELDVIYTAQEGMSGGQRYPSPEADDDADGKIDEDWLDGRDNDGDGAIDEDFAAASNEMFYCEYTDTDPNIRLANPEHNPLGLLVQHHSMVWQDPLRDDFVGLSYRFISYSADPLAEVYLGFFADFDIGPRHVSTISDEDFAGFWEGTTTVGPLSGRRNVKLSIGYMFDDDGDFGAAEGYVGLVFLGARRGGAGRGSEAHAPLRNFRMFAGSASFEQGGDPTNDEERYRTLAGTDPMALPPPDPITGLRPTLLSNRADDHRIVLSAGPFDVVDPGDSLVADFALVIGTGFDGMVAHAAEAKLLYDGSMFDRDGDPMTGVDGREYQVHWYAEVLTPVALEEFAASSSTTGVLLRWSMSASTLQDASGVFVLRSESATGPFASITSSALPPQESMTFEDSQVEAGRSYWYRLRLVFADGAEERSHAIRVDTEAAERDVPRLHVSQGGTHTVEIEYWVAAAPVDVRIGVFDVAGREVRSWFEGRRDPGAHQIVWDRTSRSGQRVARGMYLVQLQAGDARLTRKLILVQP
jgi:hypothetical protein